MARFTDNALRTMFGWMPARVALGIMGWFGFINLYMTRTNLSIIIVAMVQRNATHAPAPACLTPAAHDTNTTPHAQGLAGPNASLDTGPHDVFNVDGGLDWSETVQGFVLGGFFYGYTLTQVVGGRGAEVMGTRVVFGACILAGGVCAVLSPLAARAHYAVFIALRVIQGVFQGVSWPSMHACIARWIPPHERPRFISFVYHGSTLSTAITMTLCGWVIERHGWEAAFYVTGALSLAWCVVWFSLMHDSPQEHPRISREELEYLENSVYGSGTSANRRLKLPVREIATSMPVWAIVVADVGSTWGMFFFLIQLPTFMNNILGFSIKDSGELSSLPFLCRYLGGICWATLCDWLVSRGHLSVTAARKLFSIFALWGPGVMVVGVIYAGCDGQLTVILMCIAMLLNSAMSASVTVNHTDISPNFAGTLFGIGNTFCSVGGFVLPSIVGYMTHGQQTMEQWRKVFWLFVPIYGATELFYLLFSSGTLQHWNQGVGDKGHQLEEGEELRRETKEEETLRGGT